MKRGTALLIGGALGGAAYLWHHGQSTQRTTNTPAATPVGLASLHEIAHLRAALTRNAKRSKEHGDLVTVVGHHRSWPGTSLRHR